MDCTHESKRSRTDPAETAMHASAATVLDAKAPDNALEITKLRFKYSSIEVLKEATRASRDGEVNVF